MYLISTLWLLLTLEGGFCHESPSTFTVSISITQEGYRTIPLSLGTPPREFNLWLDTGSDPTWVLAQSCVDSCPISDANRMAYIPSESSSYNATGETLDVSYLGGSVSGTIFIDALSIANSSTEVFTRVLLANYSNWVWLDADGMLGLAFPRAEDAVHASLLESLFNPETLEAPEFAIYAGQELSPNNGIFQFGGHSSEYNRTDVTYFNVQRYTDYNNELIYWSTYINRVDFSLNTNGSIQANTVYVQNYAVWDTGSSWVTVPEAYIEDIYANIGMNYSFIKQGGRPLCEDLRKLDFNMTMILPEGTITIRPADLIAPGYTEEQYCWPMFEPTSGNGWLVGMHLIRNFYTVWDMGGWEISDDLQPRLGFAELKAEYHP
ncbi:aspartic peptidase domain-containing protein [Armillaria novae-zelandiae]|uniref:Aspartic peptidase domain-containing protein n=1 Tax=Armillaria novae-zelandiae TaxID=153914 RepID=A0AA39TCZ0_9AGAR|nr:aspartic peptidase domain-containing protein [Armillaria novae-zelandiae]